MVQNPYKFEFIYVSVFQEAKCFNALNLHTTDPPFYNINNHLTRTNLTIYWDATLLELILHLTLF